MYSSTYAISTTFATRCLSQQRKLLLCSSAKGTHVLELIIPFQKLQLEDSDTYQLYPTAFLVTLNIYSENIYCHASSAIQRFRLFCGNTAYLLATSRTDYLPEPERSSIISLLKKKELKYIELNFDQLNTTLLK